jgi:predicted nucleotidyltransferase
MTMITTRIGQMIAQAPEDTFLLYGSHARGDNRAESDVDVLRISTRRALRERMDPRISLHTYSIDDLVVMSKSGSLFILHLIEEARVLHDSRDFLRQLSDAFRRPASYTRDAQNTLAASSAIIDIDESLYLRAPQPFMGVAIFLCRTLVYAEHADRGPLSFSLRSLGETDEVASMMHEIKDKSLDYIDFLRLRQVVRCKLGCDEHRGKVSSLHQLAQQSGGDQLFKNLVRRIISGTKTVPYPGLISGAMAGGRGVSHAKSSLRLRC